MELVEPSSNQWAVFGPLLKRVCGIVPSFLTWGRGHHARECAAGDEPVLWPGGCCWSVRIPLSRVASCHATPSPHRGRVPWASPGGGWWLATAPQTSYWQSKEWHCRRGREWNLRPPLLQRLGERITWFTWCQTLTWAAIRSMSSPLMSRMLEGIDDEDCDTRSHRSGRTSSVYCNTILVFWNILCCNLWTCGSCSLFWMLTGALWELLSYPILILL